MGMQHPSNGYTIVFPWRKSGGIATYQPPGGKGRIDITSLLHTLHVHEDI